MIDGCHLLADDYGDLSVTLTRWQAEHAGLGVLALVPEAEAEKVSRIQAACREMGIPLFGAIFPMLVTPTGFRAQGAWLLRFDEAPTGFLVDDLADASAAAAQVAEKISMAIPPDDAVTECTPTLFLVFDGMVPNVGTVLTELFRRLHKGIRYAGVNAGSEHFQPMPCLFDHDRIIGSGLLGLLIDRDVRHIVAHDYPVTQTRMRATSTTGNRVSTIDGRPAFEVYRDISQHEFGVRLTHDNFYDHAVHYPLGVVTAADVLVRIPVAFDDDGAVFCIGEIPPNSMLRLLHAPPFAECRCPEKLLAQLAEPDAAGAPLADIVFYCAGRRMHFGPEANNELSALWQHFGTAPLPGALSLGEIDTMPEIGIPRFHNAAIVCLGRETKVPST